MAAINTIIHAFGREERRLNITSPDPFLSQAHQKKADHNLVVMTDLKELGHDDWVIITAYYSMYHAALALLAKIGLDSKDHASTAGILEYFFKEKINKWHIAKFNSIKNQKDKIEAITIEEKYIKFFWDVKSARESIQYGISIDQKGTDIIINAAREFVIKINIVLTELNEPLIESICKEIKYLHDASKTSSS